MANRSREKVALIIFVLLLALGAFLIGSYIVGGHSLNVAATQINDTFGNMEGYSAIVFEGTQKPEEESSSLREDASVSDEKHQHDSFDASALPEDKGQTALGESFDLGDAQDPPNASGSASSSADDRERAALEIAARSSGLGKESAVALDEVVRTYQDKGARVFALDVSDFGRYADNVILKRGATRVGVFSVSTMMSASAIEKHIGYFAEHEVDYVVALAANPDYLKTKAGIDIVISTYVKDGSTLGQTVQGSYVVPTPEIGEVGVVLVSPSNVVSSKVVEEIR